MKVLFTVIFLMVNYTKIYASETCVFTPVEKKADSAVKVDCPGQQTLYLLGATYAAQPKFQIRGLEIPLKSNPKETFNISSMEFSLEEKIDCESINCLSQLDVKKYLLQDKEFKAILAEQAPDADLSKIKIAEHYLADIDYAENTPVFGAVPKNEYTKAEDILSDPDIIGLLEANVDDDNALLSPLPITKYAEPSKAYIQQYGEPTEDSDFEWNDDAFTDEEVAGYESEAEFEELAEDGSELLFEDDNGDPVAVSAEEAYYILQAMIDQAEQGSEASGMTEEELQESKESIAYLENMLIEKGIIQAEPVIGEGGAQDSFEEPSTDVEPETTPEFPNSYEFKAGGETFQITELSKSSVVNQGTSEVTFTISDGKKIQKFSARNGAIEELRTGGEGYGKLRFENNAINLTIADTDIETPLEATNLGAEMTLEEFNQTPEQGTLGKCLPMLADYLENKDFSDEDVKEFLEIQGKLSLHRLAWAHLNNGNPKERIENKILRLIKQKYRCEDGSQNCERAKIAQQFDNMNVKSRNFLAKALPLVKDTLNAQASETDPLKKPFHLGLSDVKMLEILASFEKIKDGRYDHRQFPTDDIANNITNFASLVNSGYLYSNKRITDQTSLDKNKQLLSKVVPNLEKKFEDKLKKLVYKACISSEGKDCQSSIDRVDEVFNENVEALTSAIMNSLFNKRDEQYLNDLTYGKLWLRVAK